MVKAERWARRLMPAPEWRALQDVRLRDEGHGFDTFGAHADWVRLGWGLMRPLYRYYFRLSSHQAHHIPAAGAAMLAANHSGTVPIDGMMLWADVLRRTHRVTRVVADNFVPRLPFVAPLFFRAGAIGGSRRNVHVLLDRGELLAVFPEGVPGISKRFTQRYQLQNWREGHVELALKHRAPVVPVAIIGAEEQMPQLAKLPIRLFGAPYLPITATPVPLPVHYHIHYGAPIHLEAHFDPAGADDPDLLEQAAQHVRAAVESLIAKGLRERRGVFR